MTADTDHITLTAQCLCKVHSFSTQVPQSKLPLDGSVCHCTSCRNVTGAMYSSDTDWPGPTDEILNSDLKTYVFTTNVNILFCGTCSSPLFWNEHYEDKPQNISVFTGALNNVEVEELIKFSRQIFVGDTVDGGVSPWLQYPTAHGAKACRWQGRPDKSAELGDDWPGTKGPSVVKKGSKAELSLHCRCKGVNLVFRPGNVDFSAMDADAIPFYIDPESHKHLATLDPCNSCRLSAGADIMSWTFALLKQIDFAGDSTGPSFPRSTLELKDAVESTDRDSRYGTLSMYRSSPDVQRYFCSRCSASVFYAVDDRPDLVDVAVGLLHSPDGARAESILAWHLGAKMMGEEDHKGGWREGFVNAVKETSEKWRLENGYPKTWARVKSESSSKVP
ncbi:Mss4-like protein [Fusarium acuminatum]|uniref:Mss4-like protein n=1 Tax=Fusarium acuminatum TaxID=5515 RepID=A0ABZ2WYF3_9HYPO